MVGQSNTPRFSLHTQPDLVSSGIKNLILGESVLSYNNQYESSMYLAEDLGHISDDELGEPIVEGDPMRDPTDLQLDEDSDATIDEDPVPITDVFQNVQNHAQV